MVRQHDGSPMLLGAILCWLTSLLILGFGSLYAWGLRDGFGLGMVESQGMVALGRFWVGIRPILCLFAIPVFGAGCLLYRRERCEL